MFIHNGIAHDYCFEQSAECLARICDRVIVADCESTDGSLRVLTSLSHTYPNIEVVSLDWRPGKEGNWLGDVSNTLRHRLGTDWWFTLQGDEVTDPKHRNEIRTSMGSGLPLRLPRHNFWGSRRSVAPHNRACAGAELIRICPIEIPIVLDGGGASDYQPSLLCAHIPIFHYGFLRRASGAVAKSILMEDAYTGGRHNPLWDRVGSEGMGVIYDSWPASENIPFSGEHPQFMDQWLNERGHL